MEVIGRRGEVFARHAVVEWPCRIGRAYDMDIILDDPHVAACHAILDRQGDAAGGGAAIVVTALPSHNGVQQGLPGKRLSYLTPQTPCVVSGEEILRLGHTTLRVRPADYAVEAELPIHDSWLRRDAAAYLLVPLLLALVALKQWSVNWDDDGGEIFTKVMEYALLLLAWVLAWGTAGRIFGGTARYLPIASLAALAASGALLVEVLVNAAAFAFDFEERIEWLLLAPNIALLSALLYKQFQLLLRLSRRAMAVYALLLAAVSIGALAIPDLLKEQNLESPMLQTIVLPAQLLATPGLAPQRFLAEARERLFK